MRGEIERLRSRLSAAENDLDIAREEISELNNKKYEIRPVQPGNNRPIVNKPQPAPVFPPVYPPKPSPVYPPVIQPIYYEPLTLTKE